LLSLEGGANITETDNKGNTALLLAANGPCCPPMVQWLLEYEGAQLTKNNENTSVWTATSRECGMPNVLKRAYAKGGDGEYVSIDGKYSRMKTLCIMET
jgi:hypothetical protein